jgi:hypothetical protein
MELKQHILKEFYQEKKNRIIYLEKYLPLGPRDWYC